MSMWAITEMLHTPIEGKETCKGCLALSGRAKSLARVLGSNQSTMSEDNSHVGRASHRVTVQRVIAMVEDGEEDY